MLARETIFFFLLLYTESALLLATGCCSEELANGEQATYYNCRESPRSSDKKYHATITPLASATF